MSSPIERVLVTLDAVSENRTAIDTAVRVAARTGMPLHGLFVEDQDLLRLADLPFARQVTIGKGAEPLRARPLRFSCERRRSGRGRSWSARQSGTGSHARSKSSGARASFG